MRRLLFLALASFVVAAVGCGSIYTEPNPRTDIEDNASPDAAGSEHLADSGHDSDAEASHDAFDGATVETATDAVAIDASFDAIDNTGDASPTFDGAADAVGDDANGDAGVDAAPPVTPGALSLRAGRLGGGGNVNGVGIEARFGVATGVVTDHAGNLFVADRSNGTIRKIDPQGVVTTFAGSPGEFGAVDGVGASARFAQPTGLAIDAAGNLFVADSGSNSIRKITAAGAVSTFAGRTRDSTNAGGGVADGTSTVARFNEPTGVAVDTAGNVYVADSANRTIRKITSAGDVSTIAGAPFGFGTVDATGAAARFYYPTGVAVDPAGIVFVADNDAVRRISPAGEVSTFAGITDLPGAADGKGGLARFNVAFALAVSDSGDLYVADSRNTAIRKVTAAGDVTTVAGRAYTPGSADGPAASARFDMPYGGLAVDGAGNVFVGDSMNRTVRKVTPAGDVTTVAGTAGASGSADGQGAAARFGLPTGIALDATGTIFVADVASTIRKITSGGAVTTLAGTALLTGTDDGSGASARFYNPYGVVADSAGNAYVADTFNHAIRKISPTGVVTTFAGASGQAGDADGNGAAARFVYPHGIAVDKANNVFVADSSSNTIRKIAPDATVTTIAGTAGQRGATDGTGAGASFDFPTSLAVDTSGNVYVADSRNYTVRKITAAGVVTTVAGVAGRSGVQLGALPANLNLIHAVAVTPNGNLVINVENAVLDVTFF